MRYDINRRTPISGTRSQCPCCKSEIVAKCGELVAHHWAHKSVQDCDTWSEPMTDWHIGWQDAAPIEAREIVIGPHRADVVLPDRTVIEVQHSKMAAAELREREAFYGKMFWILDAKTWTPGIEVTIEVTHEVPVSDFSARVIHTDDLIILDENAMVRRVKTGQHDDRFVRNAQLPLTYKKLDCHLDWHGRSNSVITTITKPFMLDLNDGSGFVIDTTVRDLRRGVGRLLCKGRVLEHIATCYYENSICRRRATA